MPPLAGPERDVVLHAVAGEDLDLAVVHLHRTRDDDLPLGVREDLPDAGIEVEDARRAVELLEHRVENAAATFHMTPYETVRGLVEAAAQEQADQPTVTIRAKSRPPRHSESVAPATQSSVTSCANGASRSRRRIAAARSKCLVGPRLRGCPSHADPVTRFRTNLWVLFNNAPLLAVARCGSRNQTSLAIR